MHDDDMSKLADMVTQRITQIPGQLQAPPPPPPPDYDQIEASFRPAKRAVSAFKWVAGIVTPIFLLGGAYATFKSDVAMKTDIEDHIVEDLNPVRDKVETIDHGVRTMLNHQAHTAEIRKLKRQLAKHDAKYEHQMADYRNARARQVWMRKPTKSDPHLAIESAHDELLDKPISVPIGEIKP